MLIRCALKVWSAHTPLQCIAALVIAVLFSPGILKDADKLLHAQSDLSSSSAFRSAFSRGRASKFVDTPGIQKD